ncbi:MAG: hypothetical protein KGO94_09180 [Alphaproteobacteria bacterium]|nr:hypothetical protein [Alphaproteobacteria bacterium]
MYKIVDRLRAAYANMTQVDPLVARLIEDNRAFMASSRGWNKSNVL